mmetsp:Transcript_881/g.2717  ORF Transcript_881/g.2717 Transcript_881/m.2717 type:complete len:285 (-) Transcript_881:8-862(-)
MMNSLKVARLFLFNRSHFLGNLILVHALGVIHRGHHQRRLVLIRGDESVFNPIHNRRLARRHKSRPHAHRIRPERERRRNLPTRADTPTRHEGHIQLISRFRQQNHRPDVIRPRMSRALKRIHRNQIRPQRYRRLCVSQHRTLVHNRYPVSLKIRNPFPWICPRGFHDAYALLHDDARVPLVIRRCKRRQQRKIHRKHRCSSSAFRFHPIQHRAHAFDLLTQRFGRRLRQRRQRAQRPRRGYRRHERRRRDVVHAPLKNGHINPQRIGHARAHASGGDHSSGRG